jgi:hypothetical protein
MAGTTLQKATYNSSTPLQLKWNTFTSGGANNYVNVNGAEGSKVLFLIASESTKVAVGSTWYIGTSDSATTRSASANLYSGAALNRMKLTQVLTTKGHAANAFRSSGSTRLVSITALGPFETARFKDSDGYINFAKAITGSSVGEVTAILIP